MAFETLRVGADGAVGRLTLTRPERLNAIGPTALQELAEAARWFDARPGVRVVVVAGEGRAFSVGADLKERAPQADSWIERRDAGQYGLRMADAIEGMRAVTIARVHGFAIGGGLVLMLACDLRVAAADAVFQIPEVDLGMPLAWGGIPRLVREIGPARTKELVMTCRRFTPAEAFAAGVLNRVVPPEDLDRTVDELAAELAAKPSVPVVLTKEHVNAVTRTMSAAANSYSDGDVLLYASGDPDSREAARAYRESRLGGGKGASRLGKKED
jgi:enoyl-CoA hydratase/carnithine racemase